MTSYISAALRRLVIERADGCCEYCLLHERAIFFAFEIDHIIAEKHNGTTVSDNLCLSCPDCNRLKGTDIGSIDRETHTLTPLFNPRTQTWGAHFRLNGVVIEPLSPIGRVTVRLLQMNSVERLQDREIYTRIGVYPCRIVNDE